MLIISRVRVRVVSYWLGRAHGVCYMGWVCIWGVEDRLRDKNVVMSYATCIWVCSHCTNGVRPSQQSLFQMLRLSTDQSCCECGAQWIQMIPLQWEVCFMHFPASPGPEMLQKLCKMGSLAALIKVASSFQFTSSCHSLVPFLICSTHLFTLHLGYILSCMWLIARLLIVFFFWSTLRLVLLPVQSWYCW